MIRLARAEEAVSGVDNDGLHAHSFVLLPRCVSLCNSKWLFIKGRPGVILVRVGPIWLDLSCKAQFVFAVRELATFY